MYSLTRFLIVYLFLIKFIFCSTQTGPSIETILLEAQKSDSKHVEIHLDKYEPNYSIRIRTNYYHPSLVRLSGSFSINSPFNHGLIMVVQNIMLRSYKNGTCQDHLEVSEFGRRSVKICGRAPNPLWNLKNNQPIDIVPKSLVGQRTFDSPLGILNITILTQNDHVNTEPDEFQLMRENVVDLIFTAYKRCSEPISSELIQCGFRKCIRKSLQCDQVINCDNQFGHDEMVCKSLRQDKENAINHANETIEADENDEENDLVDIPEGLDPELAKAIKNSNSKSRNRNMTKKFPNFENEPEARDKTPILVGIFFLLLFIGGTFAFCSWLGHSEAGKLIKNYGVREGLRRSFRRSRIVRNPRPKPITNYLEQSLNEEDLQEFSEKPTKTEPSIEPTKPYSKNSTLEMTNTNTND